MTSRTCSNRQNIICHDQEPSNGPSAVSYMMHTATSMAAQATPTAPVRAVEAPAVRSVVVFAAATEEVMGVGTVAKVIVVGAAVVTAPALSSSSYNVGAAEVVEAGIQPAGQV